jgi:hypothetical protein
VQEKRKESAGEEVPLPDLGGVVVIASFPLVAITGSAMGDVGLTSGDLSRLKGLLMDGKVAALGAVRLYKVYPKEPNVYYYSGITGAVALYQKHSSMMYYLRIYDLVVRYTFLGLYSC